MRTLTFAAVIAATALHAEGQKPLEVLGTHYEPLEVWGESLRPPPCPLQEPLPEPGQLPALRRCTPVRELAPYDRRLWPLWAQIMRRQVGDPRRH
jgi:hypothetical protein